MSFRDTVSNWFRAGMPDDFSPPAGSEAPTLAPRLQPAAIPAVLTTAEPLRPSASEEENRRLREENERLKQERLSGISARAAEFADRQGRDGKVLPHQEPHLRALYELAARVDLEAPLPADGFRFTAAEGKQVTIRSLVECLAGLYASAPDVAARQERLASDPHVSGFAVVSNGSAGTDPVAESFKQGQDHAKRMNRRGA
jgi:hypothetical protein